MKAYTNVLDDCFYESKISCSVIIRTANLTKADNFVVFMSLSKKQFDT